MSERIMNLRASCGGFVSVVVLLLAQGYGSKGKIIGVIFISLISPAFGQAPIFHSFQLPDKYEALEINKALQDRTGFFWLATNKGLFRFDGVNYRGFTGNMPDENITALAQDAAGRIWVGCRNGKICFIEKNVVRQFVPEEGLSPAQVSDMLFDKDGILWFSTYGDGIYYYMNNRLYRLDDVDGMPDLYAYDLEEDAQGNVWAGTDGGIAVCARKEGGVEVQTVNYSNGLPDNIITKITKGTANTMLVATQDAGVVSYDAASNKVTPLLNTKWRYGSIADLLQIDNWIWIAADRGLVVIDRASKIPSAKIQSPDRATALSADAEGGIWVGSNVGLKRTTGQSLQIFEPEGDRNVLAVAVGTDGDTWFSTSKGLFRRTIKKGSTLTTLPLAGTSLADKKVISLFADADGFIWAGFYGEGAIRINPNDSRIKYFNKELLNGNVVHISGRKGTIWLATLGGASAIKTDNNFAVRNYSQADGLATDYLYQVFADSKNRVWFATDRAGIDMLDDKGFHHFTENLSLKVIYGFAEDSLHHLWANVQNEGLFVFDEKGFKPFPRQHLLHDDNFNAISSGPFAEVMAIHRSGIDIFDVARSKFYYLFHGGTDLSSTTPNLNAIAKGNDGSILIGTSTGLLTYRHCEDHRQDAPLPRIDLFEVNGKSFDFETSDELKYDENYIKIGFTGFWYQNPTAINFSYKLENFDVEWNTTDNRAATYSKLPPGEYVFKLKASDSKDFSNAVETEIRFVVKPPFWATKWFYVLTVLTVSISAFSIIRYREGELVKDKRALEAKVVQRTLEIEQKSNEIRLQAEEIKGINENLESIVKERTYELERKNKALEEYAFINAHKLRAPLARILGLVHLMKKNDTSEDEKIYMEHLQLASRELDTVVGSITEAIERGSVDARPQSPD